MIRKILSPVNQAITHIQDWADEKLRHLCGRMTPEIRLAVILLMLLFFGGLSIYFTVSSIYRIGKEDGETIRIEHIRQLYKRQNKLFHFQKTFCSRFTFINTKQNVHFTTKNRGNLFSCLYFRSEPSKKINGWVKCWILPIL